MFEYKAKVYYVVDGDTIDVEIDLGFKISTKQRIRLAGINTPERGKPGFSEASDHLKSLILGKQVKIRTSKASKWGYMLGDIHAGEIHVNSDMITNGHAKPYHGEAKTEENS